MWIFIVGVLVLAAGLALWLGYFPPANAEILITIRADAVKLNKGKLRPGAKANLSDVLSSLGISEGFIAVTGDRRVWFSRNIPKATHQRLRNVILN